MVNWNSAGVKVGDHLPSKAVVKALVQEGDRMVLVIELTDLPAGVVFSRTARVTIPVSTPEPAKKMK